MGIGQDQAIRAHDKTRAFATHRHTELWGQGAKTLLKALQEFAQNSVVTRALRVFIGSGSRRTPRGGHFAHPTHTDIDHTGREFGSNPGHVGQAVGRRQCGN